MVCFHSTGKGGEEFASEEERRQWDEEQKRLDREWYSMDQGYDDSSNPFSGTSEEYTKKKEEEFEQKKKKRMSEKQRQINKVGMIGLLHGMWIKTQQGGYVWLTARNVDQNTRSEYVWLATWNMNQITQKVQFILIRQYRYSFNLFVIIIQKE